VKSNAIHIENITTKPVARKINLDNITRYQDMVVDALRDHGSGALSAYFFWPATPSNNGQSEKCTGQPTPKLASMLVKYLKTKKFCKDA